MTDPDDVVHPQWVRWAAENLAQGAEPGEVADALVQEGVAAARATALVDELARSAAVDVGKALARRVKALETMLRLRREHRRSIDPGNRTLDRIALPSPDEFLARYWVPGIPVVVRDLVPRWPAFGRWSFDDLAQRFGEVDVEASVGRSGVEMPDADWQQLRQTMPLRELLTKMTEPGNDVYVISKNAILANPGMKPLLSEIELPAEYFTPPDPKRMTLWIGPAGTHTPLHHDGDNAMFCQVVGRKRIRLAPPESLPLLDRTNGVYSRWDPKGDLGEDDPESLLELVLEPGEALFLPAGWWHQIDALEPSLSVSVLHFCFDNDFAWYKPGSLLRGSL